MGGAICVQKYVFPFTNVRNNENILTATSLPLKFCSVPGIMASQCRVKTKLIFETVIVSSFTTKNKYLAVIENSGNRLVTPPPFLECGVLLGLIRLCTLFVIFLTLN